MANNAATMDKATMTDNIKTANDISARDTTTTNDRATMTDLVSMACKLSTSDKSSMTDGTSTIDDHTKMEKPSTTRELPEPLRERKHHQQRRVEHYTIKLGAYGHDHRHSKQTKAKTTRTFHAKHIFFEDEDEDEHARGEQQVHG
ncbi:hypothetical protein LTS18_010485 [Coniosporium uncinatum]|uniref:Uncharacterized protein n=1 Tax=Coniosporium uncinatum TaxID=93489 RepID=A0ACC3CZE7_9PEZI|nr:hypothetical protein LTS18_010485 [Coniosporium uncinatum]